MKKNWEKFVIFFILIIAFVLRYYKIDIALADHHSWRQADTAAVARNFVKEGFNFLKPKIDNMTPLHPNIPNDERLFLVEPPIYNSIVAGVYSLFGVDIKYARLVSIFFSLGSIIFIYLISSIYWGKKAGIVSSLFFAVLPFNIFFSRVVLPEPMIIFFNLGMFYYLILWLEKKKNISYFLFILFSAVSFSQKAFPLFYFLPIGYFFFNKFKWGMFKERRLYFWLIISIIPFILWRKYISAYPEGVPANLWLFNQNNIRFKGAFFHWIFAKRIGELILGFFGLPLLIIGILYKQKKEGLFFHFWLISMVIYLFVFASGNVTHDYYQIPLIPIFCIFLGKAVNFLLFEKNEFIDKKIAWIIVTVCFVFGNAFSWYEVRNFYNIQSGVDLAGEAVDKLAAKDALVLTGDSNDSTLLYNTNRWGWSGGFASNFPNNIETIEKVKKMGGSIYVATKFEKDSDFGKYMLKSFRVLKQTDQYIIFDLNKESL